MLASNLETYQHSPRGLKWIRNFSCCGSESRSPGDPQRDKENIIRVTCCTHTGLLYRHLTVACVLNKEVGRDCASAAVIMQSVSQWYIISTKVYGVKEKSIYLVSVSQRENDLLERINMNCVGCEHAVHSPWSSSRQQLAHCYANMPQQVVHTGACFYTNTAPHIVDMLSSCVCFTVHSQDL